MFVSQLCLWIIYIYLFFMALYLENEYPGLMYEAVKFC